MTSAKRDREEKIEILRNERGVALVDYARTLMPKPGGRFQAACAQEEQKTATQWAPHQGSSSHWSNLWPDGQEPPLGYSVHAVEPVGNPAEIEASLKTMMEDLARAVVEPVEAPPAIGPVVAGEPTSSAAEVGGEPSASCGPSPVAEVGGSFSGFKRRV